jgi:hypothetical protein
MSVTMTWNPEAVLQSLTRRAEAALEGAGEEFLATLKARTPVRTGRLQAGWELVPDPGRVALHVVNEVPYAVHVEARRHDLAGTLAEFAPRFASIVARGMNG